MNPEDLEAFDRWNLGPGRVDYFPEGEDEPIIPVLLQLADKVTARTLSVLDLPGVYVPDLFTRVLSPLDRRFDDHEYVTVLLDREDALRTLAPFITDAVLSPPLRRSSYSQESGVERKLPLRERPPLPGAVVLGVIDDGVAFAHHRFLAQDGTRVEYYWMQDGPPPGPIDIFAPRTSGRELSKDGIWGRPGIDTLRNNNMQAGLVDEDLVYRLAEVLDPNIPRGHKALRWRLAHGTHVLDIACNTQPDANFNPRIVAVQLPIATTGLPATTSLACHVVQGIWYILVRSLDVATRLDCGPLPVVINLSYGITDGPHNGKHLLERAIDSILRLWRLIFGVRVEIVIGSGNSHLDRLHATVRLPAPGPQSLVPLFWRIQPDDRTPSVVEIWMPPGPRALSRFQVQVIEPDGGRTLPLDEDPTVVREWVPGGPVFCAVEYHHHAPSNRGRFRITVQPTERLEPIGPVAHHGVWRIELRNLGLPANTVVHAYIARDQAPYGYPPHGRQSYFDHEDYLRFDNPGRPVEIDNASVIRRYGSINGMATGDEPSTIAGVRRSGRVIAPYSAGGTDPPIVGRAPDALAISDDSAVHTGVLAAGSRSGSVVAMNGTSVATPMVTRWVAGELAANRNGGRSEVQAAAVAREPLPLPRPDPRGGFGRIVLAPASPAPGIARRDD